MNESTSQPVKWGILGTARIATKVAAAIRRTTGANLDVIASRSQEKADAWMTEHQAARAMDSYEAVLEDPDVEAVYIPLPPSLHHEWTIKAAEHGKHVLCEKPLALTVSQTEEMAAACLQNNVQLMDGVMWYHHPRAQEMLAPLRAGKLGELRRFTTGFTFCWPEIPQNEFRLERGMGGGSLYDLGWYNVGAALLMLEKMPARVYGTARWYQDVDLNFSGMMWYDDEPLMMSFDCGFDTGMRRWLEIAGTEGSLVCDDFTRPWNEEKPRFWLNDTQGNGTEIVSPVSTIQEDCMIADFCEIVRSGTLNAFWPELSIKTQRVCDLLDQSARAERPLELK